MRKRGFTLIELLVAMTIIGLLSSVGLGMFNESQKKARDARRMTDLREIQTAMEQYYFLNNNAYLASSYDNLDQATYFPNGVPKDPKFDTLYNQTISMLRNDRHL
jgi:general secretion pathway protein G